MSEKATTVPITSLADIFKPVSSVNQQPLYRQITTAIRDAIANRVLKPDDALPPERELAESFGVSRITIRKAISGLVNEGVLDTHHGSGNFVRSKVEKNFAQLTSFSEEMDSRGMLASSIWLTRSVGKVRPEEALNLRASPGTEVYRFKRIRLADDVPMSIESTTILASCLPSADSVEHSIYAALLKTGNRPVRALQRLSALILNQEQATMLGAKVGDAGLLVERMGFNKARFGRIECHESITAYAREILLQTMEIAQGMDFDILHGIVDSLWVRGSGDPRELCDLVSETVGIPLKLKGHYNWIVFPSNRHNRAGAMNRYFGLMTDGKMKVRGIELRRRDTPRFIRKLQHDMLDQMKCARTVDELYSNMPRVLDVVRRYADEILSGGVDPKELVFTTHTRHKLEDYRQKGSQAAALYQLREEGVEVQPGQAVQYIHTNYRSRYFHNRVKVAELIEPDTVYDKKKYYDITLRAAESILRPFGYDRDVLDDVVMGNAQMRVEDFLKRT